MIKMITLFNTEFRQLTQIYIEAVPKSYKVLINNIL